VRRRQRDPYDCDAHQREAQKHRGLASHAIAHSPDHQAPIGLVTKPTPNVARDASKLAVGNWKEKTLSRYTPEKCVGQEIVELERVPSHNGRNVTCRNRSRVFAMSPLFDNSRSVSLLEIIIEFLLSKNSRRRTERQSRYSRSINAA